jgi:CubicO group peptidase (beta-lactamase class C family)
VERVSSDRLTHLTAEARSRWHVPGIAVGVWQDGDAVFAAEGVLELGRDEPVKPETRFRIASITKPFVATLAMTLAQEGLLSLDEPPPGANTTASIRQLLSHQGGLAIEWPGEFDSADDDEALLRLAAKEPELLPVGPGELFSYCNTGYWFVGAGIARVSGTTFEQAVQSRVLQPLNLGSTSFEEGGSARGHEQLEPASDEHRPVEDTYPRVRRASGGLWSAVGDLLVFGESHFGGPSPLSSESVREMQKALIPLPGGSYGLGWFRLDGRPIGTVEHPGSSAGFHSLLLLVPDERIVFAALTNSSRGSAAIRDVADELGLGIDAPPTVDLAAAALDALAGRYEGQGLRLDVARSDGNLRLDLAELNPFTGETPAYPTMIARPVGQREFEVADGEFEGDRIDFPRDGFARTLVLAQRVE